MAIDGKVACLSDNGTYKQLTY